VRLRLVVIDLALQFTLAVMLLKLPAFQGVFLALNRAAQALRGGGPGRASCSVISEAEPCLSRSRVPARLLASPFAARPLL
jgi:hypothetical protein